MKNKAFFLMHCGLAVSLAAGAAVTGQAQQESAVASSARPALLLQTAVQAPLSGLTYNSIGVSSSVADEPVSLSSPLVPVADATQPPPGRRYGRPTYHDSMHNADGSYKLAFEIGGGFATPAGRTGKYQTTSYKFSGGVGWNFSKTFGVLFQGDYDHFGITKGELASQLALYNKLLIAQGDQPLSSLGGNVHIWSATLNPIINYYTSDSLGAYVVGGGGFYRKVTEFTSPTAGTFCQRDNFGNVICFQEAVNSVVDHYSNNAFGFNGGIGFTYKFSRFSGQKVFAEARYVWVDNQASTNNTVANNGYPPANYRTGYFPVTIGLRW